MAPNAADMASLTRLLSGDTAIRRAQVRGVYPRRIAACTATTLRIEGLNLWRSETVILGGRKYGSSSITLLPDMAGILLEVSADAKLPIVEDGQAELSVLTPYGTAIAADPIAVEAPPTGGCSKAAAGAGAAAPAADAGLTISDIQPGRVTACAPFTFKVVGTKLQDVKQVQLAGAFGKIEDKQKDGTWLNAVFSKDQMASVAGAPTALMIFWDGAKKLGQREIAVTAGQCGGVS